MVSIAIMGHGVVGSGVAEILLTHKQKLFARLGEEIYIKKVLDLREFPDSPIADRFTKDFEEIINDLEIRVVVEVMGGLHPSYEFVSRCIKAGKSVVTSNKELVAAYGAELLALAKENNVNFMFEAAVGGGIPIIRPINQCLVANNVSEIAGILNGTTNFILTKMIEDGMQFADALKLAQELGFAEKDPTADIEGHDACRKICILASRAFGKHVYPDSVHTEGITKITLEDVKYAEKFGCVIKLIGRVKKLKNNKIDIITAPMLVPLKSQLANIDNEFNGIMVRGDCTGDVVFYGKGAGKLPTASAVCGDIIDTVRNICHNACGRVSGNLFVEKKMCPPEKEMEPCYFRLLVNDRPGVLAAIASTFAAQQMSIASVIQKNGVENGLAELIIITYKVSRLSLDLSLRTLQVLPVVKKVCSVLRVEDPNL